VEILEHLVHLEPLVVLERRASKVSLVLKVLVGLLVQQAFLAKRDKSVCQVMQVLQVHQEAKAQLELQEMLVLLGI